MKFQTGDIILAHGRNLDNYYIQFKFFSWWNHCALVFDERKTAEMTTRNFRFMPLSKYTNKCIRVLRLIGITEAQQRRIYSSISFNQRLRFDPVNLLMPLCNKPRKGYYWCTSYIEFIYKEALNMDLNIKSIMRGNEKKYNLQCLYDYRSK